jgi:hypothetical protein
MRCDKSILGYFLLFFFFSLPLRGQAYWVYDTKLAAVNHALDIVESKARTPSFVRNDYPVSGIRQKVIAQALRDAALTVSLEYFCVQGAQSFEVFNSAGERISRLYYPHKGTMVMTHADIQLTRRWAIGGSYGNSRLARSTAIDTDWIPSITPDIWWESHSEVQTQLQKYNINLYYRLFDADDISLGRSARDTFSIQQIDKFFFDVLFGYQELKGRYETSDLVDTVQWWSSVNEPYDGLDSFYKVHYRGPRAGFRSGLSVNDFVSLRTSLAYSWLKTQAHGWWNMRNYHFWEQGLGKGKGTDFLVELSFQLTPQWFLGLNYNYSFYSQKKLEESGDNNGSRYTDEGIIRDVNNKLFGPGFVIGCKW